MLIGRSLPSQPAFSGTAAVHAFRLPACPGTVSPGCISTRYPATLPVPSGPGRRSARGNARRRSARSRHPWLGCRYAPRPACRACGSGTTSFPSATRRSKSDLTARAPHPTHIRIAGADRRGRGDRLAILSLSLPRLRAGGTGHRARPAPTARRAPPARPCRRARRPLARPVLAAIRAGPAPPCRRARPARIGVLSGRRVPGRCIPGRARRAPVGPDVDPPAGQPRREPRVLAFLADRQRELVAGESACATNSAGSAE